MTVCRICGRLLRDPESIRLGCGPVCEPRPPKPRTKAIEGQSSFPWAGEPGKETARVEHEKRAKPKADDRQLQLPGLESPCSRGESCTGIVREPTACK